MLGINNEIKVSAGFEGSNYLIYVLIVYSGRCIDLYFATLRYVREFNFRLVISLVGVLF